MSSLEKRVLAARSKTARDSVVDWVGNHPDRFAALVALVVSGDPVLAQRAAWPLSYAGAAHPSLVKKHAGTLIRHLDKPNLHNAIKRNITRLFDAVPAAPQHHGRLMNACFRFITDPDEKAAIKAFSLSILDKLSGIYPDIRQELISVIDDRWETETAAFRSRARHILRTLR